MSFDSLPNKDEVDPEVASFIQMESQKAELQAQIHKLADVCWEQCVDRPKDKLDSRAEACVSNCVERFIDTSMTIATRFQKLLQEKTEVEGVEESNQAASPTVKEARKAIDTLKHFIESQQDAEKELHLKDYVEDISLSKSRQTVIISFFKKF